MVDPKKWNLNTKATSFSVKEASSDAFCHFLIKYNFRDFLTEL